MSAFLIVLFWIYVAATVIGLVCNAVSISIWKDDWRKNMRLSKGGYNSSTYRYETEKAAKNVLSCRKWRLRIATFPLWCVYVVGRSMVRGVKWLFDSQNGIGKYLSDNRIETELMREQVGK